MFPHGLCVPLTRWPDNISPDVTVVPDLREILKTAAVECLHRLMRPIRSMGASNQLRPNGVFPELLSCTALLVYGA